MKPVEKITKQLMKLMSVKGKVTVKEEEDVTLIDIQSEDSALLIGHWGETIGSLQLIIGLVIYKAIGEWKKIIVNVNNWREMREEYIKNMAVNAAQKVKFSGQSVRLPYLRASERRIVHLYLKDNPDVITYSEGEGEDRRLIIGLKKDLPLPEK